MENGQTQVESPPIKTFPRHFVRYVSNRYLMHNDLTEHAQQVSTLLEFGEQNDLAAWEETQYFPDPGTGSVYVVTKVTFHKRDEYDQVAPPPAPEPMPVRIVE